VLTVSIPSVNSANWVETACTFGGGGFGPSLLQELTVIRAARVRRSRCG